MRLFAVLFIIMAAFAFVVSCGDDITEVAWTNSNLSDGTVRDIVWAEGDTTWNEAVAKNATSSSKEVDKTVGTVECFLDTYDDVVMPEVKGSTSAFALNEGESQVITFQANEP